MTVFHWITVVCVGSLLCSAATLCLLIRRNLEDEDDYDYD